MTYTAIFFTGPGLRMSGTLHTSMESTYLPTSPTKIDLHREGDKFIIEQFSHSGFTNRQLKKMS